jgi:hypothetical protein
VHFVACVRACASVRVCVRVLGWVYDRVCATGTLTGLQAADGRSCICVGHRSLGHVAAGATWTRVTASAPWAARYGHTSVINAAGAIFVIGGGSSSYYNDVWVSTDGGADRALGATILCVTKPKFEVRALTATWLNLFWHVIQI